MTKIKVSGEGKSLGRPDVAVIQVRVQNENREQLECRRQNNMACESVINIFKEVTTENDIHAVPARVTPSRKDGIMGTKIVAYQASNTITAIVRKLEIAQQLVQKLNTLDEKYIQVSSFQFDIENKQELEDEARRAAFANAKKRAETYGEEIGMTIDRVKSIEENLRYNNTARHPAGKFGVVLRESNDFIDLSNSPKETLETGDVELTVDVNVCFIFGPPDNQGNF